MKSPPIPIETVVLQILDLAVAWDELPEDDGIQILGGLSAAQKKIVLNEKHRDLFETIQGLMRSTIGHEAGHWEYDVDKNAIGHPFLLGFEPKGAFLQRSSRKYGSLSVFRGDINIIDKTKAAFDLLNKYDDPDQARIVNRFAAALSMPKYLLKEAVKSMNILSWPGLYKLRNQFDVSITALKVRLEQLGYNYVDENGQIHRSKLEAHGQGALGL